MPFTETLLKQLLRFTTFKFSHMPLIKRENRTFEAFKGVYKYLIIIVRVRLPVPLNA